MTRISVRFAVLMAAAAVLPLLAFGAVAVFSVRGGTEQAVIEGNQAVATQIGSRIELHLTNVVRIIRSVAADLEQTRLAPWQQERILKNHVLEFQEFAELTLLDDAGGPLISTRLDQATVQIPGSDGISLDGAMISRFSVDDDLLPTSLVAVPLQGSGPARWLVGRLNLEELWAVVNRIRVGEEGYASVVTGEGTLLAHGSPTAKARVASGENLSEDPLIVKVRDPRLSPSGVAFAEYGPPEARILAVGANVPKLGWTVVIEQPRAEAFAIPLWLQKLLGIAITVALLAMLTIGYLWGRSFINPILSLTRGTKALAEGRLEERVAVESRDELGQLATAFNNMADKLVELQEDVKRKERQAMFGRVSVGLVHDLSNPIQNIGNACKMMGMMFEDLEYRETFKRTTERELAQIKRMLDDLRNIAKPVPLQKFPLDLNKAIAELVESMQPGARSSGLDLETALCFGPLYIQGDVYALNRVYGNLIRNAFQATAPQGTITVKTLREADHAVVQIADTGAGIPPDRLATIFDDFVTTKKRGLGLGLAIAKRIVEQLDGTIAVTSDVGRGTTFTMRFPLTRARPEQLAS